MRLTIDTESQRLELDQQQVDLYSLEAFRILSALWVKVGWACRHSYNFSWAGRPIIQLPHDVLRLQELIWELRPTVIVETGVAHGGSAVFYASMLQMGGGGRVIAIDIEIRPHNRAAIEAHPLAPAIQLIERSSTAAETLAEVRSLLSPDDRVLVVLDSNHSKAHVAEELRLYAPLVSPGSFLVATDGVMQDLWDVPGGKPEWRTDNPTEAAREFLMDHPEFELTERFEKDGITYFPGGWLRRKEVA